MGQGGWGQGGWGQGGWGVGSHRPPSSPAPPQQPFLSFPVANAQMSTSILDPHLAWSGSRTGWDQVGPVGTGWDLVGVTGWTGLSEWVLLTCS